MPVALSTSFTGWVALPLDNSNYNPDQSYTAPAPTDPAFEVRFLSRGQITELLQAMAYREETVNAWMDRALSAVRPHVVSTRNGASLEALVSGELEDLAGQIAAHSMLGYDEVKKSKLPRSSGRADSAKDANSASAATPSPAPQVPNP